MARSESILARTPRALSAFLRRAWLFSRTTFIVVATIAVVLIALRIALPYVLHRAINTRLANIPAYEGHVDSIHVAVWRGAYTLGNMRIAKRGLSGAEPFFAAQEIDFSLAWRELFRGKFVSDIVLKGAELNFVKAASPEQSQLEADRRWQSVIQDIFPIDITHLKIDDGRLHYVDRTADPVVDLFITHMNVLAAGLRNRHVDDGTKFPASLSVEGDTIGHGRLFITAEGEPLAVQPHFELLVRLEKVSLPALNEFLRAYGNVDVKAGEFQLYVEVAARDGRFEGYAKPFFTKVEFTDLGAEGKSVMEKVWQLVVDGLVKLFKNKERDQLATRIPFAGEFGSTDVGVWATITSMLRHGFVRALPTALEHSVDVDAIPADDKVLTPKQSDAPTASRPDAPEPPRKTAEDR
jgi:hypothetical protein